MAVVAVAAVGAWLAPAGYAALGWTIGMAVGSAIFTKKQTVNQEGPRLADMSVQTSTDGAPIMQVHGAARIAGNIIWSAGIKEAKSQSSEDVGGKGGGGTTVTTTSYSYSCSFALSLCAGPIIGIRRIWADGKIIYDLSSGADPASLVAADKINYALYLGTETQMPDPTIESVVGAGNAPAYRGQAYIVFTDLQLVNFGNRIPNLTVEVLSAGDYQNYSLVSTNNIAVLSTTDAAYNQQAPYADELGIHLLSKSGARILHHVQTWGGELIYLDDAAAYVSGAAASGWAMSGTSDEPGTCWTDKTEANLDTITYVGPSLIYTLPIVGGYVTSWAYSKRGADLWAANLAGTDLQICSRAHGMVGYPAFSTTASPSVDITPSYVYVYVAEKVLRFDRATGQYQQAYTPPSIVQASISPAMASAIDDDLFRFVATSGLLREVYHWVPSTDVVTQVTTGIDIYDNDYNNLSTTHGWQMFEKNEVYGVWNARSGQLGRVGIWTRGINASSVSLQGVVSSICAAAGLAPAEYNVSSLSGTLDGYILTQPMSARAALEPLMRAHFFDAIESGKQIKFIPRGGASAATIAEADLAAHGDSEAAPDTISIERDQELELPRAVTVLYMDPAADYQQGSQRSTRLITAGRAEIAVEMPMVLSADRARQIADVLLTDAWMARKRMPLALPPRYIDLEPTDVITVQGTSATHTLRIIDQEIGANGVIRAQAVAESASAYTSTAVGAPPAIPAQALSLVGPTALHMLDIPILRDLDDTPGCYLAAGGYLSGWKGTVIEQSRDAGESWSPIATKLAGAPMGFATTTLAAPADARLWDHAGSLNVRMLSGGTLSSSTEDGVIAGANLALLGVHGRWELLHFRDATLEANGTWTLRSFLRGCFGTEYAADKHAVNDVFVLVASTSLLHVKQATADISLALKYHALSIGAPAYTPATVDFTNSGLALRPYPVNNLAAIKQANGDWLIQWTPRVRKGQSWMTIASIAADPVIAGYQVEIMSGSTVKRSVYVTGATTFTYPAGGQQQDFTAVQSTLKVRVYAYNEQVGLGYGVEITAPANVEGYLVPVAFTAVAYAATSVAPTDPAQEPSADPFRVRRMSYFDGGNFYGLGSTDKNAAARLVVGNSTATTWEVRSPLNVGIGRAAKSGSLHAIMINVWFGYTSTGLDGSWTYVQRENHPLRQVGGGYYYDMTSDGTRFVACGDRGILESTTDFVTWTEHAVGQIGLGAALYVVRYGNGVYLVHGTDGGVRKLWRSADRVTWTDVTPAGFADHTIVEMVYAAGKWVMVGQRPNQYLQSLPAIWLSDDNGLTWALQADGGVAGQQAGFIAHNGTVFAVTGFRYRATSADGVTWSAAYDESVSAQSKMVANGSLIVAADVTRGVLRKTTDGVTWTDIQ